MHRTSAVPYAGIRKSAYRLPWWAAGEDHVAGRRGAFTTCGCARPWCPSSPAPSRSLLASACSYARAVHLDHVAPSWARSAPRRPPRPGPLARWDIADRAGNTTPPRRARVLASRHSRTAVHDLGAVEPGRCDADRHRPQPSASFTRRSPRRSAPSRRAALVVVSRMTNLAANSSAPLREAQLRRIGIAPHDATGVIVWFIAGVHRKERAGRARSPGPRKDDDPPVPASAHA